MSRLDEIRERDAGHRGPRDTTALDRRELLRRLDLALPHLRHHPDCDATVLCEGQTVSDYKCTCGLDAALREIEA